MKFFVFLKKPALGWGNFPVNIASEKYNIGKVNHVSAQSLDNTLVLAASFFGSFDRMLCRMIVGRFDNWSSSCSIFVLQATYKTAKMSEVNRIVEAQN
jgi:hypothetical protein